MNRFFVVLISFFLLYCSNGDDSSFFKIPNKVLDLESHQLVELIKENPGVILDIERLMSKRGAFRKRQLY